jgi:hypothetical protein
VTLGFPELQDVQLKATDPQLVRRVFDRDVVSAVDSCKRLMESGDAFFRIWLGAPNLRIQLVTIVEDENRRLEVLKHLVDLGTAIARKYQRAAVQ